MPSPPPANGLWQRTPLIYSSHISQQTGRKVYLKLENLQPTQSFKQRGITNFIAHVVRERGAEKVHCVIASTGNAALAAAWTCKRLGVRCAIFVPEGCPEALLDTLRSEGAEVQISGTVYPESLASAQEFMRNDPDAVMVPSYNDELLWDGYSSIITEVSEDLQTRPDAIICSVGGGGMLGGILKGCESVGWHAVKVVAAEAHGSDALYWTMLANRDKRGEELLPPGMALVYHEEVDTNIVHLDRPTSRCLSLGAAWPAPKVVHRALGWVGGVSCVSVPDELPMSAVYKFANEHMMNVELACGGGLSIVYTPGLLDHVVPEAKTVVLVVCGGSKVSVNDLVIYQKTFEEKKLSGQPFQVLCDGERWSPQY